MTNDLRISGSPVQILLVEDCRGESSLMAEIIRQAEFPLLRLEVVRSGTEALAYLRGEGRYLEVRKPDLVLLDLNLSTHDGVTVLSEIQQDDALKEIPFLLVTSIREKSKIRKCCEINANLCARKSGILPFVELVSHLEEFWFKNL